MIQDLVGDYKYKKIFYNTRFVENVLLNFLKKDKLSISNYYEICHPNNFARLKNGVSLH